MLVTQSAAPFRDRRANLRVSTERLLMRVQLPEYLSLMSTYACLDAMKALRSLSILPQIALLPLAAGLLGSPRSLGGRPSFPLKKRGRLCDESFYFERECYEANRRNARAGQFFYE